MKKRRSSTVGWVIGITILTALGLCMRFVTPTFIVSSGSMAPRLPVGTIIVTHPSSDLHAGDVITFTADNEVITHTLIGYRADGSLVTKGDANQSYDVFKAPVEQSDVIGKTIFYTSLFTSDFWHHPRNISILLLGMLTLSAVIVGGSQPRAERKKESDGRRFLHPV